MEPSQVMKQQGKQLSQSQKAMLQKIIAAARAVPGPSRDSKRSGISVLFTGLDTAAKTLTLQILARELDVDLFRVDLSAIVSKYIGETEKNLRQVFETAEPTSAILFFDEADALFGKRTDVKDSHDRYANIEVNYLLQRMESYKGVAILALNQKTKIDETLRRRFRFVFEFKKS